MFWNFFPSCKKIGSKVVWGRCGCNLERFWAIIESCYDEAVSDNTGPSPLQVPIEDMTESDASWKSWVEIGKCILSHMSNCLAASGRESLI